MNNRREGLVGSKKNEVIQWFLIFFCQTVGEMVAPFRRRTVINFWPLVDECSVRVSSVSQSKTKKSVMLGIPMRCIN